MWAGGGPRGACALPLQARRRLQLPCPTLACAGRRAHCSYGARCVVVGATQWGGVGGAFSRGVR